MSLNDRTYPGGELSTLRILHANCSSESLEMLETRLKACHDVSCSYPRRWRCKWPFAVLLEFESLKFDEQI